MKCCSEQQGHWVVVWPSWFCCDSSHSAQWLKRTSRPPTRPQFHMIALHLVYTRTQIHTDAWGGGGCCCFHFPPDPSFQGRHRGGFDVWGWVLGKGNMLNPAISVLFFAVHAAFDLNASNERMNSNGRVYINQIKPKRERIIRKSNFVIRVMTSFGRNWYVQLINALNQCLL